MKFRRLLVASLFLCLAARAQTPLRVPAHTAYLDPVEGSTRISARSGISGWANPAEKVLWYGEIKTPGQLECALEFGNKSAVGGKWRFTLAGISQEIVRPAGDTNPVVTVGLFTITNAGYQTFTLESLNPAGQTPSDIQALVLSGPATKDAHFNLLPRKNAASVHLNYPLADKPDIAAFYCEVTAVEDPLWTFYMACGWHRGYFGMQVNSPTERRIIFSVWDSGGEAVDRAKVASEDRVTLIAKGEDVYSGDFGNEGTGGHSHLKFLWKTGEKQKFIVTAQPTDATHTIYSGYYFRPDQQKWMLISSWKAPKEGGWLKRPHSFSENFGGDNGHLQRKALYGNQWIKTSTGDWQELTVASFSHDVTGRADRFDRFMGVENGQFFLAHGGFKEGFTPFGEKFTREPTGQSPAAIVLPPLPEKKVSQNEGSGGK